MAKDASREAGCLSPAEEPASSLVPHERLSIAVPVGHCRQVNGDGGEGNCIVPFKGHTAALGGP
jgi:hypothetical protein